MMKNVTDFFKSSPKSNDCSERKWELCANAFAPFIVGVSFTFLSAEYVRIEEAIEIADYWKYLAGASILIVLGIMLHKRTNTLSINDKINLSKIYAITSILPILGWGYLTFYFYPQLSIESKALFSVVTAGMAAGSITMTLNSRFTALTSIFIYMLPFCSISFSFGTLFGNVIGVLGLVYNAILSYMTLIIHSSMTNEFSLSSQNKNLLNELKKSTETLVHNSKMISLGEMAGGIAHEINNPLAIIYGQIERLQLMIESGSPEKDNILVLGKMQKTCDRIVKIVRGLRKLTSKEEGLIIEPKDIQKTIEESLALCLTKFNNSDIQVEFKKTSGEILVPHNEIQISQVLLNLLSNSFDALKELDGDKWISIKIHDDPNRTIISVQDSGEGLNEAIAQKIMDPFFTTKDVGKGTGLGLSISQSIMSKHQGSLIYNPNSIQTQFDLIFPKKNTSLIKRAA